MPRYNVGIGILTVNGTMRWEVGGFLHEATFQSLADPELKDIIDTLSVVPVARVPTPCARNLLVEQAKQRKIDILFMLDDDSAPPTAFFKTAIEFLVAQPVPSAIACPYVTGNTHAHPDSKEEVPVFEWQIPFNDGRPCFALNKIGREDAARRTGIQRVSNIGTHNICYDMRIFDLIEPPYYDYQYDDLHTRATETEDNYFHRRCYFANIPVYCHWDLWSGHWKSRCHEKPWIVTREQIETCYMDAARRELIKNGSVNTLKQ